MVQQFPVLRREAPALALEPGVRSEGSVLAAGVCLLTVTLPFFESQWGDGTTSTVTGP